MKKKNKSNKNWINKHILDPYVIKSFKNKYRSRAIYKLKYMDNRYKLIRPSMKILEIGSHPGSWTQFISKKINSKGKLICIDIIPMKYIKNSIFLKGDITNKEIQKKIFKILKYKKLDLILSDASPKISGIKIVDNENCINLLKNILIFSFKILNYNASILIKSFQNSILNKEIIEKFKKKFVNIKIKKPQSSLSKSSEIYLLFKGFKF